MRTRFKDANTPTIFIQGTYCNCFLYVCNTSLDSFWLPKSFFLGLRRHRIHSLTATSSSTTTRCFVPSIKCKYRTYILYTFCLRILFCEINIIMYCYASCYEYLTMFDNLFQILVSVLDLVSKSHMGLTIARLRLAIIKATSY